MIKGFKEFLMRGNVVDLAVAVVIGIAFQAVITAITESIIYPIVAVFGGSDASGLTWQITSNEGTTVDFGALITAILNFFIIAAAVYLIVVLPINKLRSLRQPAEEELIEENTVLLREIRDLLANGAGAQPPSGDSAGTGRPAGS